MKNLRFDLYSGYSDDSKYTELDRWIQCEGETIEEIADAIREAVIQNADTLSNDEEG